MNKTASRIINASMILMAVAKLTGLISWSWWTVTAPLWGTVLAAMVFVIWIGIYRGLKIRIVNTLNR